MVLRNTPPVPSTPSGGPQESPKAKHAAIRDAGRRRRARPTVQELEVRMLLADGLYQIVEAQLQFPGGVAGHDLLVVLNPQGQPIKELDGLATGSDNLPTPIGILPWTTRLKVWDNVALESVPDSQGNLPAPGKWASYYDVSEPQTPIYSGTEADVLNRWDAALACGADINALNLYYPVIGLGDNSNSVTSTEIACMGLNEPTIPDEALLVPGRGSLLLGSQTIDTVLQQHNITPATTNTAPSVTSEDGQNGADGSFTLTTLFSDGSRDVETDSAGGTQEVLYAANGQIMTDATVDDAASSLAVDEYLNPGSDAILTETFPLDSQGDISGGPAVGYQVGGQTLSADQMAAQFGSGFAAMLINSSNPAVQIAAKALGSGVFTAAFDHINDLSASLLDPTSGSSDGLDSVLSDTLGDLASSTSGAPSGRRRNPCWGRWRSPPRHSNSDSMGSPAKSSRRRAPR